MKRSLVVVLTIAFLLFAFAGVAMANQQAAERLQSLGVIEGYPDGTLGLDRNITRAEFAKIVVLSRGMGEAAELLVGSASQYSDVPANAWFTGWINVASAQNLIKGYPDGTFRPNANITYAEAVTMILRTLGYNDNLPGAWPMNYLVKGAELGITSGIVSNSSATAVRGDVFAMLSRALDKDYVRWNSDDAEFENRGWTLLQEMLNAKLETEGWVIANFRTDEGLDPNEITIGKLDGTGGKTFELKTNDDVDWLLGLEVKVKHNSDDEIAYVEIKTAESNIIFDQVIIPADDRDIKLRVQDREYSYHADGPLVFVNFEPDATVLNNMYGKFVLKNNRIASIIAFNPEGVGAVTEIDDGVVEYVVNGDDDGVIDFDDYDKVVLLDTKLRVLDGELKVHDVIYYFEDEVDGDDVLYVVVSKARVSGELERLRFDGDDVDRIIVNGTTYRVSRDNVASVSLDGGDSWDAFQDKIVDLLGEDVVVSRDFLGYAMLVVGEGEATSGWQYGVLTWVEEGRTPVVTIFTSEGKEVEYKFEDRNDLRAWSGSETDQLNRLDFETNVILARYKINSKGEIAKEQFQVFSDKKAFTKDADSNSVRLNGTRYYITSGTKFFKGVDNKPNEVDPSLLKYSDIYGTSVSENNMAVAFVDGTEIKAIVFVDPNFIGTGKDDYYGVVTSRAFKDRNDDWFAKINVFGEGEKEYKLSDRAYFVNENLVQFRITSAGEARSVAATVYEGTVENRDGNFLTIDGETFKVASGAVLYVDGTDFETIRLSRIAKDDKVEFLLKDDEIVALIVRR